MRRRGYDLGVVISASHNPYEDNGIKVFGGAGRKFSDELEDEDRGGHRRRSTAPLAERAVRASSTTSRAPTSRHLARSYARPVPGGAAPGGGLRERRDLVPGAARSSRGWAPASPPSTTSPTAATSTAGCGATAPEAVAELARSVGADLGLAFDGDGDRCILADAERPGRGRRPRAVPGRAAPARARARCKGGAVVATVMSNVGPGGRARQAGHPARAHGGGRPQRARGDGAARREPRAASRAATSIFLDHEPTGDGLLTGLKVLEVVRAVGPLPGRAGRRAAGLSPGPAQRAACASKQDIEAIPEVRQAPRPRARGPRRPRAPGGAILRHRAAAARDGGGPGRGRSARRSPRRSSTRVARTPGSLTASEQSRASTSRCWSCGWPASAWPSSTAGASWPGLAGGDQGFAESLGQMGFPLPLFFAWAAALAETLGGAAGHRSACSRGSPPAFCAITMAVAAFVRHHALDLAVRAPGPDGRAAGDG